MQVPENGTIGSTVVSYPGTVSKINTQVPAPDYLITYLQQIKVKEKYERPEFDGQLDINTKLSPPNGTEHPTGGVMMYISGAPGGAGRPWPCSGSSQADGGPDK